MDEKELLIEQYNLTPKFCKTCGIQLPYKKRNYIFCSRSCSAKTNNIGIVRNKKIPVKNCIVCGKVISKKRKDMCSKCITEFKILNGLSVNHSTRQKYLIKIRGHKCERCNNTHWEGELIHLDTHHIDGSKKNNNLTNLKLLCKNCHALTPTYCSKKGKVYTIEDCIRDFGEPPFCKCKCGQKVIIDPHKYKRYKKYGYPKYISGYSCVKIKTV